jgi:hypothetical protein
MHFDDSLNSAQDAHQVPNEASGGRRSRCRREIFDFQRGQWSRGGESKNTPVKGQFRFQGVDDMIWIAKPMAFSRVQQVRERHMAGAQRPPSASAPTRTFMHGISTRLGCRGFEGKQLAY